LTAEDFREGDIADRRAEQRIRKALNESMAYDGDARRVRAALWTMFTQHAWLQIKGETTRRELRDALASRLLDACARLQDEQTIAGIYRTLRADSILFHTIGNATPAPSSAMRQ
ncbi:MAG: hypothetical protein KFH87_14820, partial [Bacteroidetes bacterium]|nr:hypothetical protein [Bacteroidota bacterium]